MSELTRRQFMRQAAVGAAAVGWDPLARRFGDADSGHCSLEGVPRLDGVLLTDPVSRQLAADDYGHIVHRRPCAVLRPASTEDIVKMVRFAREREIKVSMRGQGHSAYGQSQVEDGIVIDSTTLARIHGIDRRKAVVDAGVLWGNLTLAAASRNATPPVLTGTQNLSVGGTLGLGGIESGPMRYGAIVDNLLELQVVTGDGDLVTCSPSERPQLFDAVRAGLGQCAIIVRASVRLVPMPASALVAVLHYKDIATLVGDLAVLVRERRFDSFQILGLRQGDAWVFDLHAGVYFTPPDVPDRAALLRGLHDVRKRRVIAPIPYLAWPFRYEALIGVNRAANAKGGAAVFVPFAPERVAADYLGEILALTPEELGSERFPLFAGSGSEIHAPLLRLPDAMFVGMLVSRIANASVDLSAFLASNRKFYDRLVAMGGVRYPFDAIPDFTQADWRRHFGSNWGLLEHSKQRYDPANILGSGQGIFT